MTNIFDYNFEDEEKNFIDDDIDLKRNALDNIIADQQAEEQKIKDNYNSLGSRANRFLDVLGAGLLGENTSQVMQNQRDNLNKQLQSAQARYKDQRDSAYNQYKDLLARREALDKTRYERERDKVKDDQFNRTLDLNKTKADRDFGLEQQKLQMLKDSQNVKESQAQKELENAEIERQKKAKDIMDRINTMKSNDTVDAKTIFGGIYRTDNGKKSDAEKENINLAIIEYTTGLTGADAQKYLKDNQAAFPKPNDNADVTFQKWSNLGFTPTTMSPQEKEIQKNIDQRNNDYIKKINKFTKDPKKTVKIIEQYGDDPVKAYEAILGQPSIVKSY